MSCYLAALRIEIKRVGKTVCRKKGLLRRKFDAPRAHHSKREWIRLLRLQVLLICGHSQARGHPSSSSGPSPTHEQAISF